MSYHDERKAMRALVRLVPHPDAGAATVAAVARDCGMGERRTAKALRALCDDGEARRRRSWESPYYYVPTEKGRASLA